MRQLETMKTQTKVKRGFAAMSKAEQRRICSMGGKAVMSRKGHAAKLGRLGGLNSHRGDGKGK